MSELEIEKELNEMREKLEKTHAFAEKLPVFKDCILSNKYTGNEKHISFGKRYKSIYLGWGINRNRYKTDTNCTVTNYDYEVGEPYDTHLFCIYINTLSLFDEQNKFNLSDFVKDLDLFFFDKINTTFYATDDQIIPLLEALNKWYLEANSKLKFYRAEQEVVKAEENLKRAKEKLAKLKAGK